MKTKLFFYSLICFAVMHLNAQQTHQLNWGVGINDTAASLTIEVGDTVEWEWIDAGSHNVVRTGGTSSETFNSGNTQSGIGTTFSHTFTEIGTNDYHCVPHQNSMFGTITVVADGTLSTNDFDIKDFSISPNPAKSYISLKLPQEKSLASVQIIDLLGKLVYSNNTLENRINISSLSRGVYLVKISTDNSNQTKRFIKQ